jgi:copper chaperone CopZ
VENEAVHARFSFYNVREGAALQPRWQRLLALMFVSFPLGAEFLRVELKLGGLDCISCAQSVDRMLKRIKGVDVASFRTADSVAVVELKPGNAVALDQLRDAVKGIGYTPGAAQVTARGQARSEGGKWLFRLPGPDVEYPLEVPASQQIPSGATLIVEGAIAGPGTPLHVTAVRSE